MVIFIDVHHHFFSPDLDKTTANTKTGWRTPEENLPWTPEVSLKAMDATGIQLAVLSFPALPYGQVSAENRALVRSRNDFVAGICQKYPERFGFFATMPFLDDEQGALDEIAYAFDVIGANGVSLSSSYGEGAASIYIGDDKYEAIWAELNRRQAVVFLHGNQVPSSTPLPHPVLGLPVSEVPNETFKAAAHLVVTGRKRRYSDVRIILAHLGGSTPFLASRVAVLSHYMGCELTPEQILDDFKSFYYETALSAWGPNLTAMDNFVPHSQILFGTDFPAVSTETSSWFTRQVENHYRAEDTKDIRFQAVMGKNALGLFPQLVQRISATRDGSDEAKCARCLL